MIFLLLFRLREREDARWTRVQEQWWRQYDDDDVDVDVDDDIHVRVDDDVDVVTLMSMMNEDDADAARRTWNSIISRSLHLPVVEYLNS